MSHWHLAGPPSLPERPFPSLPGVIGVLFSLHSHAGGMGMLELAAGWRRAVPAPLTADHGDQPMALVLLELCWVFSTPLSPPELCGVCAVGANPAAAPWIPKPALTFRSARRSRSCLPALQGDCLIAPGPCHRHWQGVCPCGQGGGLSKGWGHRWSRDPTARTAPGSLHPGLS